MSNFENALREARQGVPDALFDSLEKMRGLFESRTRQRLEASLRHRVNTSDVVQSAYLQAFKSIQRFEGATEEAFISWFLTILDHRALSTNRHYQAMKRNAAEMVFEDEYGPGPTPSREVAGMEEYDQVQRALDRLPEDYRRVIILKRVENLSHEDIAKLMGRTTQATRSLLSRAQAALALELRRPNE